MPRTDLERYKRDKDSVRVDATGDIYVYDGFKHLLIIMSYVFTIEEAEKVLVHLGFRKVG